MTEPNRKLTVRIAIANPAENDIPTGAAKTTLRWDRIAMAAVALLVIGVLIYGGLAPETAPTGSSAPLKAPGTVQKDTVGDTDVPAAPDEIAPDIPAPAAPDAAEPGDTATGESETDASGTQPGEVQAANSADTRAAMPPLPAVPAAAALATAPKTAATDTAATADASSPAASAPAANEPAPARPQPPIAEAGKSLLTAGETRILSKQVTRFLITNGIRSLEPAGAIGDIKLDDKNSGVLSVYAFSDVSGLRGKTLQYRWLKGAKVVAAVRVGVGSNRWRSSSSKILNDRMRGPWRVELRTSDGTLLAYSEFVY